jgi:hypothetical protein
MLGTMAGGAADCQFWHRNLGQKVGFSLPSSCITPFLGGVNVGSHFSAGNMSFRTSEGSLSLVLPSCWPISFIHIAGWDCLLVQ